ncbi:unnamed protein product [Didymodactylos carnosus]|uniref:Uncharacterized protein n=1 Tax=Didymodactylos carnosus TaxID=1234261 RepID=A0A814S4L2_9BILA|nr:unnamed protein product [Didymodactylos carnosus]CAF3905778.1 unnamed protein product [Didymodactylos carnosus]
MKKILVLLYTLSALILFVHSLTSINCTCDTSSIQCNVLSSDVILTNPCSSVNPVILNGSMQLLNGVQLPTFPGIQILTVQNFLLYGQILDKFPALTTLTITKCVYNATAKFLEPSSNATITNLTMSNNNLLDGLIPENTFEELDDLTTVTLIEPKLNTTSISINSERKLATLVLELGFYQQFDLNDWTDPLLFLSTFEIRNLTTLNVFPAGFFSRFYNLKTLTLGGTYRLTNKNICAFCRYPQPPGGPIIVFNSANMPQSDTCVQMYVDAISESDDCDLPCGTESSCETYAEKSNSCDFNDVEEKCNVIRPDSSHSESFTYKDSCLSKRIDAMGDNDDDPSISPSPPKSDQPNSINVGAVVGAIVGLTVSVIVLCITIFCVHRYRQKNKMYIHSEDKYRRKSNADSYTTQVSVATSKSTGEPLFSENKNAVVAPPLYNVSQTPSSLYLPSAPPRSSVSTQATHFYEEVLNT